MGTIVVQGFFSVTATVGFASAQVVLLFQSRFPDTLDDQEGYVSGTLSSRCPRTQELETKPSRGSHRLAAALPLQYGGNQVQRSHLQAPTEENVTATVNWKQNDAKV